ncbi:MAG: hypothetical protein PHI18_06755 [bacterium]|nr:hypothetical protein [bacterium]
MTPAVRVLHVLHAGQRDVPDNLRQAAAAVYVVPGGAKADDAVRDFNPQVITLCGVIDGEMRALLDPLEELSLPAVGLGTGPSEALTAAVGARIAAEDLHTVLNLVCELSVERRRSPVYTPRAIEAGLVVAVDDMIELLEHLLALRIPDYRERAQRVAEATLWICHHLNLPADEVRDLVRSARLREIGKLGLTDRLLFARRVERTPDEQVAYDRYPELGGHALQQLPVLRKVAGIVAHQLENFDGSGPSGLMSHQIPLGSRILRTAGAFAMLQTMSNQPTATRDVLAALESGRGTLYDPLLVKLIANYHAADEEEPTAPRTHWVRLTELEEGMVIAEDVWSRTGMKIIPNGTRLTKHILSILRQFPVHPSIDSVRVRD